MAWPDPTNYFPNTTLARELQFSYLQFPFLYS
jgi:hypothetical protein